MRPPVEQPTVDEWESETHPAWAVMGASRVQSTPGAILFDSDITHQNTVRIRLQTATRKRDLHHDYIHGSMQLAEVELSEAQWASFVSTMNSGDGVPVTLRWMHPSAADKMNLGDGYTPGFPHAPALAETMKETHESAQRAFDNIRRAFADYEAATTAKEKRERRHDLKCIIENAVPNVDFSTKQLVKQTEDVVQKARADIEAFVVGKAHQLGMDPASLHVELPAAPVRAIEA